MPPCEDAESKAVAKLISEINALDAWRERVGRRIIAVFLGTFACALGLLFYIAAFEGPPAALQSPPGPRVPGVLRGIDR
jgi:hypothetical protein